MIPAAAAAVAAPGHAARRAPGPGLRVESAGDWALAGFGAGRGAGVVAAGLVTVPPLTYLGVYRSGLTCSAGWACGGGWGSGRFAPARHG